MKRTWMIVGTILVVVAAMGQLTLFAESSDQDSRQKLDDTRAALEQYVSVQKVISEERREWALGRAVLNDRLAVVQQDIESLREKEVKARESITESDRTRAELSAENERLIAATGSLNDTIDNLESRTLALLHQLPEPLREHVRPMSQQIPEPSAESKPRISTRFGNVSVILQEINKFNNEISIHSEVLTLADGRSVEVTTMYIGVARGYFVNGSGTVAGMGTATQDGWAWTEDNALGARIAEAVAIMQNEVPAAFVQLPVNLH